MKKMLTLLLFGALIAGTPGITRAQETAVQQGTDADASIKFVEALISQIRPLLSADNVLGTPVEFGDVKIVPVVGYGFGFGAGSGSGTDMHGKNGTGSGAGGGAGGGIMPTCILVITQDGNITVLPAQKSAMADLISSLAPAVLEAVKTSQMQGQDAKPEPEEQEKSGE